MSEWEDYNGSILTFNKIQYAPAGNLEEMRFNVHISIF